MINEVIKELEKLGLKGIHKKVEKNGVIKDGILIDLGLNIAPTCYISEFQKMNYTAEEIAKKIKEQLERTEVPRYDTNEIVSKEYILKHVKPKLVSKVSQNAIYDDSEFDGIKIVYTVLVQQNGNETHSYTITNKILDMSGLTKEEMVKSALENNKEDISVISLAEKLGLLGVTSDIIPPMLIASNKLGANGAAAILEWKKILQDNDIKYAAMIPSSVHECLICRFDTKEELEEHFNNISDLVNLVNTQELDPEEWLGDKAYKLVI